MTKKSPTVNAPAAPAQTVTRAGNTYTVAGVASVVAHPVRLAHQARELAERIAREPDAYLAACRDYGVPGVTDERRAAA